MLVFVALLTPSGAGWASDLPAPDAYAGSSACEGCHTFVYNQWRTTRHSYSVRTAADAQQAGYPLPERRRGADALSIRSWHDVSYVIGGRQWIAYADADGLVQDSAYNHRTGGWDFFPSEPMSTCVPCHYTGVGSGPAHPDNPVTPGRWVEANIGCESCHGPGARHAASLEKADIRTDSSSRVCGQCHTAVGKVLPKGELHATHDLVQDWNADPHVTGVRQHSHNGFCSRCHAPYRGHFQDTAAGNARLVFTEDKQNITCIGCHNPHQLTGPTYRREAVEMSRPLPIRAHTYEGNDDDFTTTDHREWNSSDEVCTRCHRGADRVDLDHANASCNDCHNTFKRNHEPETRLLHDVNQPGISCRGCHADGDHLMAILYRDPVFLAPKHIHNLRTLPQEASAKYGFRYPQLVPAAALATSDRATSPVVADAEDGLAKPTDLLDKVAPLRGLLGEGDHERLAGDAAIGQLQSALIRAPESFERHLALVEAYAQREAFDAARDVLLLGLTMDSSRILLELPFQRAVESNEEPNEVRARVDALLPVGTGQTADGLRAWLRGRLALSEGRFADAAKALASAEASRGNDAGLGFHIALADLGQGRRRAAVKALEANRDRYPDHVATRVGLGFAHLLGRRSSEAVAALQKIVAGGKADATAYVLLGRAYLGQRDAPQAVAAFRDAIAVDDEFLVAWFALARTYQASERLDEAARVYQELIARHPRLFDAHFELAQVLKLLSDRIVYRLKGERESRPPSFTDPAKWRAYLGDWEQQAAKYRDLALSELAIAASLRPSTPDVVHQIAEVYRQSDRLAEAARFYQWLVRVRPDPWFHLYRLGTIRIGQSRFDDAIEVLRQVLQMAPTDGDSYLALGLAQLRAGQLDEAIATLEHGAIYEPFNPALYTNLGAAYGRRGDYERAQAALRRSLELHSFPLPRVHLTETNLALVHARQGAHSDACQALKRALHSYPGYDYAKTLQRELCAAVPTETAGATRDFVLNDSLDRFGEVTTVTFRNE